MQRRLALGLAAALILGACSGDVTAPQMRPESPSGPGVSTVVAKGIDVEIVVTITDNQDNSYGASGQTATNPLAPVFDPDLPATQPEGSPLSRSFTVDAAAALGEPTGTIDFGDGTGRHDLAITSRGTFDPITHEPITTISASFTHTWTAPGSYRVVVAIGNDSGTRVVWKTVEVTSTDVAPSGFAPLTSTVEAGQAWSQAFTFDDPDDQQWAVSYTNPVGHQGTGFTTGEKGFVLGPWVFSTPGTYQVSITVGDGELSGSFTHTVTVTAPAVPTEVTLTAPPSMPVAGIPAKFLLAATPTPWGGFIDWGDGSKTPLAVGDDRAVSHSWSAAGTYQVTANLTGQGGEPGTATATVTVAAPLSVYAPASVDEGQAFAFAVTLAKTPFSTLEISWGDDQTTTLKSPSGKVTQKHVYPEDGTYTITATATTTGGDVFTATHTLQVANVAPTLAAKLLPAEIPVGGQVTLSGSISDPGADTWYVTVTWGDGDVTKIRPRKTSFGSTHVYGAAGDYTVQVEVWDGEASDEKQLAVKVVNQPPVAVISAPSRVPCSEAGAIPVSGASSYDPDGKVVAWRWAVDGSVVADGVDATLALPLGSHEVILVVTDDVGATGSATSTLTVADLEAPTLSVDQTVTEIFPPDSQMVAVATVRAQDDCDAAPSVNVAVTANEPLGAGDVRLTSQPDGSVLVEVLAARAGRSRDGRIYTLVATAADASGNRSPEQLATVTVLHDNRGQGRGNGRTKR